MSVRGQQCNLSRSRLVRSFDRRKRLQISRHGSAIIGRKLGSVAHNRSHCPADGIAVGQLTRFQNPRDVLLGEIAYAGRGNIGNLAVATFRVGTAGETLAGNDASQAIARAVTLRAMARTIDEISTAIPLLRSRRIGAEFL